MDDTANPLAAVCMEAGSGDQLVVMYGPDFNMSFHGEQSVSLLRTTAIHLPCSLPVLQSRRLKRIGSRHPRGLVDGLCSLVQCIRGIACVDLHSPGRQIDSHTPHSGTRFVNGTAVCKGPLYTDLVRNQKHSSYHPHVL